MTIECFLYERNVEFWLTACLPWKKIFIFFFFFIALLVWILTGFLTVTYLCISEINPPCNNIFYVFYLFIYFFVVLGFELRASCLLGGTLLLELCLQPYFMYHNGLWTIN
jgi:hypothetical protein